MFKSYAGTQWTKLSNGVEREKSHTTASVEEVEWCQEQGAADQFLNDKRPNKHPSDPCR